MFSTPLSKGTEEEVRHKAGGIYLLPPRNAPRHKRQTLSPGERTGKVFKANGPKK